MNTRTDIVTIERVGKFGDVTFDDSSGFLAGLSSQTPFFQGAKVGDRYRVVTSLDSIGVWGEIVEAEKLTTE